MVKSARVVRALATILVTFGIQVVRVEGHSMDPTLKDQDRLVESSQINLPIYQSGNLPISNARLP